jgi:heme a synthase
MPRYATMTALMALIAIAGGALLTSNGIVSGTAPDRTVHMYIGVAAVALAAGLAMGVTGAAASRAVATALICAVAGWLSHPGAAGVIVLHAATGHLFFAAIAAAWARTQWTSPPEMVEARGWKPLRAMAAVTPAAVFVQIVLGALYRHQITGVMPHMLGAMIVVLLTLVVPVMVLQNYPQHRELRAAAAALVAIVLVQVCLGAAAFVMVILNTSNTASFAWTATGHVATGALTLGASVVMAMAAVRNIQR